MSAIWTQTLSAILAALIPVAVKLLNDWHDKILAERGQQQPAQPAPRTYTDTGG